MNSTELIEQVRCADDLIELQLRIARRADELAQLRSLPAADPVGRQLWLEAEHEILPIAFAGIEEHQDDGFSRHGGFK